MYMSVSVAVTTNCMHGHGEARKACTVRDNVTLVQERSSGCKMSAVQGHTLGRL